MEAILLAAGLGTRLRPLTDSRPKALVELEGTTLLELNLRNLSAQGIRHVVVNVHHFADQIVDFIGTHHWGLPVSISDERELLLDTGGALKRASRLLRGDGPVLVHNVDILSDIDFAEMGHLHSRHANLVTLAVSARTTRRQLLFAPNLQLVGRQTGDASTREWCTQPYDDVTPLAFSGISILSPQLFPLLPADDHPFAIIPEYMRLALHHRIEAYPHSATSWMDVGKLDALPQAAALVATLPNYQPTRP